MSTPPAPPEQPTFSHSGQRYLLGYTSDEYAIWDRQNPGPPTRRFPKSESGWSEAWNAYQALEAPPAAPPTASDAPAASAPAASAPSATPSSPTVPVPVAAPRPPIQITGRLVAQVLTVMAWVCLGLFVAGGIALMTFGGGFRFVLVSLAVISFGPALWGICWALAGVVRRHD